MPPDDERRTRLRFQAFDLERFPDGSCEARVEAEWTRGRTFTGTARGTQTLEGEIRAAARATLAIAAEATEGALALDLRGAKALKAFDVWLVVVSVRALAGEKSLRLLGAYPCAEHEDPPRGAVFAVLDATNRVVERFLEV